jgi:hypothetical protein
MLKQVQHDMGGMTCVAMGDAESKIGGAKRGEMLKSNDSSDYISLSCVMSELAEVNSLPYTEV